MRERFRLPVLPDGVSCLFAALLPALLLFVGCTATSPQVQDLRSDVNDIKLTLNQLQADQADQMQRLQLTLNQMQRDVQGQGNLLDTLREDLMQDLATLRGSAPAPAPSPGPAVRNTAEELLLQGHEAYSRGDYDP
ncbi:hypothetical protein HQ520_09735, partial [bacterium]|nr:hypothetical protein [bacterium]